MKVLMVSLLMLPSLVFAAPRGISRGYCPKQDQRAILMNQTLENLMINEQISDEDARTIAYAPLGAAQILTAGQPKEPTAKKFACDLLDMTLGSIEITMNKLKKP